MSPKPLSLVRVLFLLCPPFLFLGLGIDAVEAEVRRGVASPAAFGLVFGGASYLLDSPPGGNSINVAAVLLCIVGGALTGFALSRLTVGLAIVHTSGLWSASRRAWLLGGTVVASATLTSTFYWTLVALR